MKTKLIRTLHETGRAVAKHSPIILTVAGVVGLGATAVTTYKASKKVEEIVEDVECKRMNKEQYEELEERAQNDLPMTSAEAALVDDLRGRNLEVNRFEVARDLAGALALPISLGVGSILCIGLSYHIQNNRIVNLAAALATAQAEKVYYSNKFKKQYGEEEHERFYTPTEVENITVQDDKGKDHDVETNVKSNAGELHGCWFDKSEEYTSDDHEYNMQFIRSKADVLDFRLFRKGFILMNEVRDELGLPRTRLGALVGWSTKTGLNIHPKVTNVLDPVTQQIKPEIYVSWNDAEYIYQNIEFPDDNRGYATK